MIGVCLYWDIDIEKGLGMKRYYNFSKQTAKAFGATHLIWIGIDNDYLIADREIKTLRYDSLDDVIRNFQSEKHVFLTLDGTPLKAYKHPDDNVIYFVGSDFEGFSAEKIPKGADKVKINADIELYAHVAMGVVLSNRRNR